MMKSHIERKGSGYRILMCILFLCTVILSIDTLGCFNNKTPDKSYFSIDYTLGTQPKQSKPKYNATLVIQNMTSALAYDRQEIVYRNNPYEFQYYWYRLWASKPKEMLTELITGHLRYTQLFHNVTNRIEDRLPDYSLDIEIIAIEELDVSDTEWFAHLSLQFDLQRLTDNKSVWNYSFDAKKPVASNQPVYVVKAMSELLDEELVKAFEDMDRVLSGKIQSSGTDESSEVSDTSAIIFDENISEESEDQPKASLKNSRTTK